MRPLESSSCLLALSLVFLPACADGGTEEKPLSEVLVAASHHLFGASGRTGFGSFPVKAEELSTDRGILTMDELGGYTVDRGQGPSTPQDYFLRKTGNLILVVPVSGQLAPTRFIGAYEQTADLSGTQVFVFVDRFAPSASPNVGLYWGTRMVRGKPNPEGNWHLFSQHLILSSGSLPDPDDVGRSAYGNLEIVAGLPPGSPSTVTGLGKESTDRSLTFTGTASGFEDGRIDLKLTYDDTRGKDERVYHCGLARNVLLGVDQDLNTGQSGPGLLALVRKRKTLPSHEKLAGTYIFGMHTIFVSPLNAGVDAATGTITLNAQGGFQLQGVGHQGPKAGKFSYSGSYAVDKTTLGLLTLTVAGTKETWKAAIDEDEKVLVLVDHFIEDRQSPASPELNIVLAIRVL